MDEKMSQDRNEPTPSFLSTLRNRAFYTGFISGILWSTLGSFLYYLNLIEVSHKSFTLKSWLHASWIDSFLGSVISIVLISFLSIFVAFIYYVLCKRIKSIWMSILYGAALWGIVFYVLHPVFLNVPSLQALETSTIISTLCLYVLYSVFIGYTISYDYAIYKHKS